MITLAMILEALTGLKVDYLSMIISEACIDSRQAIPGSMFVAIPGENVDGHQYVGQAFQNGAHIALVEQDLSDKFPTIDLRGVHSLQDIQQISSPVCLLVENSLKALQIIAKFWRCQINPRVIGITGSVGKSTTKELVAAVLSQRYSTIKNKGNYNNEIGLPLTILQIGRGHQRAVLEMGFYVPGEITFLCDIAQPHVGVVTNVGTVHAERAGSQETIARGKAELVQALPPAPDGTAILNFDDPFVRLMAEKTSAQVFFYGLNPVAHLWADEIYGMGLEGIRFRLHYQKENMYLKVPLIGRHSVHTALRAAAVGLVEGLSWDEIVPGLQRGQSQLRMVAVHTQSGALILDDTYNASPESMIAALNLLAEMEGNKIAVLGEMLELGKYEERGHAMVGIRAASVCDELVAVGNRSKMIIEAAINARMLKNRIVWFETVEETIDYLSPKLQNNDVVLIKGSHGMRMDRIVSALEVPE